MATGSRPASRRRHPTASPLPAPPPLPARHLLQRVHSGLAAGGGRGHEAHSGWPARRRLSRRDWPGAARGGVAAAARRWGEEGALKGPRRGWALLLCAMAYQGFAQEYLGMPAVTRAYTTACVLTTAAVVRACGVPAGGGGGLAVAGRSGSPRGCGAALRWGSQGAGWG